ncbi:MAG: hypothetical protein JO254_16305 [Pseudolabrys sp.]|nr:hypothetical protein [Pseudolabrys sp.]
MAEPDHNIDNPNAASANGNLPHVPSPSISPAEDAHQDSAAEEPVPAANALTLFIEKSKEQPKPKSDFRWPNYTITLPEIKISRRTKRRALMAATIMLAAGFGAVVGALAMQGFTPEPKIDTAQVEETQAMRKSIAHLTKELSTLKSGIETSAKTASTQISRVNDRIAKIEQADVTASISKPVTVAAVPAPAETPPPLPIARPQVTPSVVQGWTARMARNGAVLVENRGDIYEVSPGAPLPGLGTVESIKRDGDKLVVATPKGIIVSSATPPQPSRPRQYYPPPYYYRPF